MIINNKIIHGCNNNNKTVVAIIIILINSFRFYYMFLDLFALKNYAYFFVAENNKLQKHQNILENNSMWKY